MASTAGITYLKKFFSSGIAVPLLAHQVLLTGAVPAIMMLPYLIEQFSTAPSTGLTAFSGLIAGIFTIPFTLGFYGMNLMAGNSIVGATMKGVLDMGLRFIGQLLTYYDGGAWSPLLKIYGGMFQYANPIMTYHIINALFNPNFYNEGYRMPFLNSYTTGLLSSKTTPTKNDIGYIPLDTSGNRIKLDTTGTPIPFGTKGYDTGVYARQYGQIGALGMGAILVLLIPAFDSMIKYLPAPWQASINNSISDVWSYLTIFAGILGGGGSIFAFTQMSSLFPSIPAAPKPAATGTRTGTGTGTGTRTDTGTGTGAQDGGGDDIPTIVAAAKEILGGFEPNVNAQSGGGSLTDSESALFVGILGSIGVFGAALAAFRKKQYSFPTI
jgi:hypothetical protein